MADQLTERDEQGGGGILHDISQFIDQTAASKTAKVTIQLTLQFLQRNTSAQDQNMLMRFLALDSDPPRDSTTSLLPLNEVAERLELIEKIEEYLAKIMEPNEQSFALLFYAPMKFLRHLAEDRHVARPIMMAMIPQLKLMLNICKRILVYLTRS